MTSKTIAYNGSKYKLIMWDLGQGYLLETSKSYYTAAAVLIGFFALDDTASFECLKKDLETVAKWNKTAKFVIVGSKADSEDQTITEEEAEELAENYKAIYLSVSARTGKGVNAVLTKIVEICSTSN